MKILITSDVHLGDRHCQVAVFREFVERLRPEVTLVLAGDVIDDPLRPMEGEHLRALDGLLARCTLGNVVWIRGNHDDGYLPENDQPVVAEYVIDTRLYVCHGDAFDNVMPYNRWFVRTFRWLHELRIKMGAHPMHVAQFAKRFAPLYAFLRRGVMMNAVEHANEGGFAAVACGHVHYAEDCERDGVRYVNLGAWTEDVQHCLLVDDDDMTLLSTTDAMARGDWFENR